MPDVVATHEKLHEEGLSSLVHLYRGKRRSIAKVIVPRRTNTKLAKELRQQIGDLPAAPIVNALDGTPEATFFMGNEFTIQPQKRAIKYAADADKFEEGPDHLLPEMKKIAKAIARSLAKSDDAGASNLYNQLFSTTFLAPNGQPISDAPGFQGGHPLNDGTMDANRGKDDGTGTYVDINLAALNVEVAVQELFKQKTHEGDPMMLDPDVDLFCGPDNMMLAQRIAESTKQAQTANNDKNVVGMRIRNVIVNPWLTTDDMWGVVTAEVDEHPFERVTRYAMRASSWVDEDNDVLYHKAREKYDYVVVDYRGIWASQ